MLGESNIVPFLLILHLRLRENTVLLKVAVFFSERAGIRQIAQALGLGEDVKISLNRYTCLYFK